MEKGNVPPKISELPDQAKVRFLLYANSAGWTSEGAEAGWTSLLNIDVAGKIPEHVFSAGELVPKEAVDLIFNQLSCVAVDLRIAKKPDENTVRGWCHPSYKTKFMLYANSVGWTSEGAEAGWTSLLNISLAGKIPDHVFSAGEFVPKDAVDFIFNQLKCVTADLKIVQKPNESSFSGEVSSAKAADIHFNKSTASQRSSGIRPAVRPPKFMDQACTERVGPMTQSDRTYSQANSFDFDYEIQKASFGGKFIDTQLEEIERRQESKSSTKKTANAELGINRSSSPVRSLRNSPMKAKPDIPSKNQGESEKGKQKATPEQALGTGGPKTSLPQKRKGIVGEKNRQE